MMKNQKSCIFRLKNEMQIQTCYLSASLILSLLQSDPKNNWQICQKFPALFCKRKEAVSFNIYQEYLYILCEFVKRSFETIGSKLRRLSSKMYKYSRI